jgi:chemosensory pili system protein ChpA (sensor histidine kinase/response regulator)
LNELVNSAGEVNIHHARMGKQMSDLGFNLNELESTVVRLKQQLRNLEIETEIQIRSSFEKESDLYDDDFDPLEMDKYSTIQQLSRSLTETASDVESIREILSDIVRDSETLLLQESRVSTELQEGLMRTRMVRFGGLSTRLRRIVRQTSREIGKEVELEIIGDNNELDRTILDRVIAPLEHMLRNAVAHGIEAPDKRAAAGKKETGHITIMVDRQGADVVIKVSDDGAGIDASAIRAKAIKQNLLNADSKVSDRDVLQFILKSGFSTAEKVSQVAGRGVGMDVVDAELKQLGGVLEIDTTAGKGTEFTIRLPLTLAINQALLVSAGEDVYAIPLASIEGVVRVTGAELQRFYDSEQKMYEFNNVEYELKHLGELLTGQKPGYGEQYGLYPLLLAQVGNSHFALHVDDLVGRREIVVKPVGHQIGMVRGIAGATILADGHVVLILEMSALVVGESLFRKPESAVAVEEPVAEKIEERTIMVVDDSITIRKVTARMLERNGIHVLLAKDGIDATNQLIDIKPDLMLLDIEMPRMDGFELATYIRNDDRLKDLPIIMITSRTGEKHKEKAMEIGVNQYLGKPYQEEELLENINEILGAQ